MAKTCDILTSLHMCLQKINFDQIVLFPSLIEHTQHLHHKRNCFLWSLNLIFGC